MVWPLTWAVILGTLPGVLAGAVIRVKYLPDPTTFKRFVSVVLQYIGFRLFQDIFKKKSLTATKKASQHFAANRHCYKHLFYT